MITKIIIVCIVCAFISSLFKNFMLPYSVFISLICAIIVIDILLPTIKDFLKTIISLNNYTNEVADYVKLCVKIVFIALLCEFSTEICKDLGENYIASKIEFSARISIIGICIPQIANIMNKIIKMMV